MDVLTYFIDHFPSDSRTGISFAIQNKKVRLIEVIPIKGNVIPINEVRICWNQAKLILSHGNNTLYSGIW